MAITLEKVSKIDGQPFTGSDITKIDNNSTIIQTTLNSLGTSATKNTGTASGNIPILDTSGKIDTAILPGLALTTTNIVSSQVAMLALTAEMGDLAVRTDLSKTYVLKSIGASILANWQELLTPTDVVSSVAGKTGVVTLTSSDIGLGNVTNTSDLNKPISTATQTALNLKATVIALTATEYSAITTPVSTTLYLIKV